MSHHPELHPNSYHCQGCIFPNFSTLIAIPIKYAHLIVAMVQNVFPTIFITLETILKLSDTKNHPFYEKIDFLKNHNPYFAQVSTPAWGYHVVPTFAVPQKGWSNISFITPESCIALVYSEPYEKSI